MTFTEIAYAKNIPHKYCLFPEENIYPHEIETLVPRFGIVFGNIEGYRNFAIGRNRDIADTTKKIREFYPIFHKYGEPIARSIDADIARARAEHSVEAISYDNTY